MLSERDMRRVLAERNRLIDKLDRRLLTKKNSIRRITGHCAAGE